jgi:hypothetical protein
LFACWLAAAVASKPVQRPKASDLVIASTALALGFLGAATLEKQKIDIEHVAHDADSAERWLTTLVQRHRARTIVSFSQMLSPQFPVVNDTGIRWTSRFGSMWALKAAESLGDQSGPSIPQQVIDDFIATRPDLVLVSDEDGIDYMALLSRDPGFDAAWQNYVFVEAAQGLRAFVSAELARSMAEATR